jgi:hypothetical protein
VGKSKVRENQMTRYRVTRVKKDKSAPVRYQQSGWMPFDTKHERHGQVWRSKFEAEIEAQRMEEESINSSIYFAQNKIY